MKKKRSPLITLLIVFCIIMFFGLLSTFVSDDNMDGVSFQGDKVGVIKVEGVIMNSEEVLRQLAELENNNSVKAIVLRIDSPGGAVAPSQEIYSELMRIKKTKKIVTSMGTVAASGGYYIACATDEIFANAGTITGSIGVIMEFANFKNLMEKIGLNTVTIKSGKMKDVGNPMRDMTEHERAYMQELIMDVYEQFVEDISAGRGIPKEKIYPLADGRILTGRKAFQENLVDNIGTINDAIRRAGELGGIRGKPVVIYPKKKKINIFDFAFEESKSQINNYISEKGFSLNYQMKLPTSK
ncbi:signal peptide peptidase SppA [Thermodesulfobacteriota bacterium]